MIDIKNIQGSVIYSTEINVGSKRKYTLMKEDYITLRFSLDAPKYFPLGSYVDDEMGLFEVVDIQKPTVNNSTGGYDYELRLDAYYWKWKNKIFKFTPETGGQEASWSLTAKLDVHLSILIRNLIALGYTYRGTEFEFSIDATVENKAISMTYDNMNMLDALSALAEAWECEWWVTDNVIHFGKCEYGSAVDFEIGVNVAEMTRSESNSVYATRIYAFGSTRNLPTNYRPVDESVVVNGIVQRRLMLPESTPYVDAFEGLTEAEAIEQVVIFDDVYPRTQGSIDSVETYDSTVENEDGTTTTETFYRFKDSGITFSKDYILEGEELRIKFESGLLNGMEFGLVFNPKALPEKIKNEETEEEEWNPEAQLFEIVASEDYGRKLPDSTLKPQVGDTYILIGWDSTKIADLGLVSKAETELLEKAQQYIAKSKVDPSTYSCKMFSDYMYGLDSEGNQDPDYAKHFEVGDRVNLVNEAYFSDGRESRIIGYEYNLDYPYDSPVYTVGETASYSRIGDIENKLDSLILAGQTYVESGGRGVYVIGTNDNTTPSNRNVYSSLKSDKRFLRKDKDDRTSHKLNVGDILTAEGGLKTLDAILSMLGGKGTIIEDGLVQTDRIEVRGSALFREIIYNRLSAQEGDTSYSENGLVESATLEEDGTYTLEIQKRWDNDFTAFKENDILYGDVNNLFESGAYYTSWVRVLSVNTTANTISVVMYGDEEVPGGVNHAPEPLMRLVKRGNAVDTTRQSYWYLSATTEKCFVWLEGVDKPILDEDNYYIMIGRPKNLSQFSNLPLNYEHSYIYARGAIVQDLFRVNFQGDPIKTENPRGFWSLETAQDDPYKNLEYVYDTVSHYGCEWMCLVTGTLQEPKYGSSDWAMLRGNPEFVIEIDSSNGWFFDVDLFDTTLIIKGKLYNQDVTENILPADVSWTRDTGNTTEDNAWAIKTSEKINADPSLALALPLTIEDLGTDYVNMTSCKFKCTALLRDGQQVEVAENYVTF